MLHVKWIKRERRSSSNCSKNDICLGRLEFKGCHILPSIHRIHFFIWSLHGNRGTVFRAGVWSSTWQWRRQHCLGERTCPRIPLLSRAVSSTSVDKPEGDLTMFQLRLFSKFFLLLWCRVWVVFVFIEPGSEDALNLFGKPAPTATLFGGIGSTWCQWRQICSVIASRHMRESWRVIDAILNSVREARSSATGHFQLTFGDSLSRSLLMAFRNWSSSKGLGASSSGQLISANRSSEDVQGDSSLRVSRLPKSLETDRAMA
jgi:hypothetical protein